MYVNSWLYDALARQGEHPKSSDPFLTSETISKQRTALFNVSNPIMKKPKSSAPQDAKAEEKVPEGKDDGGDKDDFEDKGDMEEDGADGIKFEDAMDV